jgi:hypothetical protein
MIFDVAQLVRHLSQYPVLDPRDVINTGTPQSVALSGRFPYLAACDVMEIEIDGLGRQRQRLTPSTAPNRLRSLRIQATAPAVRRRVPLLRPACRPAGSTVYKGTHSVPRVQR